MGYFWVSWLMKTIEHALSFTTDTWLSPLLILKDIPCKMCIWLCQMERCRLALVVPTLAFSIKSILLWRVEIIWEVAWFQIFCNGFTLIRVTDSCRLLGHDRTASLSQSRRWDLARAQFIIKHWRCARQCACWDASFTLHSLTLFINVVRFLLRIILRALDLLRYAGQVAYHGCKVRPGFILRHLWNFIRKQGFVGPEWRDLCRTISLLLHWKCSHSASMILLFLVRS